MSCVRAKVEVPVNLLNTRVNTLLSEFGNNERYWWLNRKCDHQDHKSWRSKVNAVYAPGGYSNGLFFFLGVDIFHSNNLSYTTQFQSIIHSFNGP